ncbi:E3 ubiquitin-protein ligase At3g02290-like [Cannabis sativa]|uniref:RING-type E3 ubiquitin transferase n=1 Tax=Cannabis sativa TaxID=3483 RepID=A0A7J6E3V4_CANSA|nr:E3 ubiquitin-protein ligase At3g02290-like [Cannabis sativa]XP_060971052.1 E3 ubiquitin-protein ligase At3g02290-like [Cannabis sativa]KAF4353078.1 hypothetical protein F8388_016923 [Cannabis sativa]KAF4389507.1 hypothetical protein G4B88_006566 [Cannabis sativa]
MGASLCCFGSSNTNNEKSFVPKVSNRRTTNVNTNGQQASREEIKPKTQVIVKTRISNVQEEEEKEECPTCLDEYTVDNPKIMTKCRHHFHLSCIYEWQERSNLCPVCQRVMQYDDLEGNQR